MIKYVDHYTSTSDFGESDPLLTAVVRHPEDAEISSLGHHPPWDPIPFRMKTPSADRDGGINVCHAFRLFRP